MVDGLKIYMCFMGNKKAGKTSMRSRLYDWLESIRNLLHVASEEQQSVGDVRLADASVEVERKHIELRIFAFEFLLDTSRHDVVGDTSEWLHADHVVASVLHEGDNLRRQEPTLAELGGKADDVLGVFADGLDVLFRFVIFELGSLRLQFLHHLTNQVVGHVDD